MNAVKVCGVLILMMFCITKSSAQKVVIIGLDGFSTEGFKASKHPNIDKLFAEGVLSLNTRPVMPSVTLPNWTSHLSGAGPEEHGVTDNSWTVQKHELAATDTDAQGYFPSVFKVVKEQVPEVKTAYYYNWGNLVNSVNQKYLDEVSFEDKDGFEENYSKAESFLDKNRKNPVLLFMYSVHTDHAGHEFGWMSPQYVAAIEKADTAIGQFINDLKKKNLFEGTHFMLITDHGGKEKGHGGTSMVEMQIPWAITGPKIKDMKGRWDSPYNSNKNTSLVIARIFGIKKIPPSWTGILPKEIFR